MNEDWSGLRKFAIVGTTGSGKSTLSRELAALCGLDHIELDSLYHLSNWTPCPGEEFREKLARRIHQAEQSHSGWVICGNYTTASQCLHHRQAECVVWLDLPRRVVVRRVLYRTLKRVFTREKLWNGNREPLSNLYHWDPEKNIIRWSWSSFHKVRNQYEKMAADGTWNHLTVVRLHSPGEVENFLANFQSQ